MAPPRSDAPARPVKTERTHEENQERAYIAASRRSDRSLEARLESARRASEIHKKRTGRALRVTEQDVINEEMYEEEDEDLPTQYRRLTAHLRTTSSDFNRRFHAYVQSRAGSRASIAAQDHSVANYYMHHPYQIASMAAQHHPQQQMQMLPTHLISPHMANYTAQPYRQTLYSGMATNPYHHLVHENPAPAALPQHVQQHYQNFYTQASNSQAGTEEPQQQQQVPLPPQASSVSVPAQTPPQFSPITPISPAGTHVMQAEPLLQQQQQQRLQLQQLQLQQLQQQQRLQQQLQEQQQPSLSPTRMTPNEVLHKQDSTYPNQPIFYPMAALPVADDSPVQPCRSPPTYELPLESPRTETGQNLDISEHPTEMVMMTGGDMMHQNNFYSSNANLPIDPKPSSQEALAMTGGLVPSGTAQLDADAMGDLYIPALPVTTMGLDDRMASYTPLFPDIYPGFDDTTFAQLNAHAQAMLSTNNSSAGSPNGDAENFDFLNHPSWHGTQIPY